MRLLTRMTGLAIGLLAVAPAFAQAAREVRVAVASNFSDPAKEIAAGFEKSRGHRVILSFGATGQFYAQIVQGAPFEVLLAADRATPEKAVEEGHATRGTSFTYAVGKLVLFSRVAGIIPGEDMLRAGKFQKLAIANPATAPYGAAAIETLKALQIWEQVQPKIVQGQNIAQAFQFVETGNAELGFVALSQVAFAKDAARWIVPARYHTPIMQNAVLLKTGEQNPVARAFLDYLRTDVARAVIEKYGYGVDE